MMWQNAIIIVVVAAATAYIALQIWKTLVRKSSACCDKGCSPKQEIVQISLAPTNDKSIERN